MPSRPSIQSTTESKADEAEPNASLSAECRQEEYERLSAESLQGSCRTSRVSLRDASTVLKVLRKLRQGGVEILQAMRVALHVSVA